MNLLFFALVNPNKLKLFAMYIKSFTKFDKLLKIRFRQFCQLKLLRGNNYRRNFLFRRKTVIYIRKEEIEVRLHKYPWSLRKPFLTTETKTNEEPEYKTPLKL